MRAPVLVLNAGSSSIKFALYATPGEGVAQFRGQFEALGTAPRLVLRDAAGARIGEQDLPPHPTVQHCFSLLHDWLGAHGIEHLAAVGHRIVHGGARYAAPVLIDAAVLHDLEALVPLAPLHQAPGLALIEAVRARAPALPQVACFDTAFHHDMPEVAQRLPLPRGLHDAGVRRYGFHGLSYQSVWQRLQASEPALAAGRVVIAHLGAGASACAILRGQSVDTTMSFTPLDGLPMATRCGAIDPGVLLHLLTERGYDAASLTRLLTRESGLLGVSGISGDMRVLLADQRPEAQMAVALFVHRVAREVAALSVSLGGLDALVFTAGIGEHAAPVRAAIGAQLAHLGVRLDVAANGADARSISSPDSAVAVRVLPTDEEALIAELTRKLIG